MPKQSLKNENEKWNDIHDYVGFYQISSLGRVRSVRRVVTGKFNSSRTLPSRIMKQYLNSDGYQCVSLSKFGGHDVFRVHRLVAESFIANGENKPEVNHISGDKKDNSIKNLEWVTPSENVRHSFDTGLRSIPSGVDNWSLKRCTVASDGNGKTILMHGNKDIRKNGFNPSHVCDCISGKLKMHKGFSFEAVWIAA